MVLAVAVPAQHLSTSAFEVEARGIHEHQVEAREQIPPVSEQPLLYHILDAAGGERGAAILMLRRKLLTEPSHRAIKVMKIEFVNSRNPVILAPAIRRAIGAATEQTVQHGEEHRSFQGKAVFARSCQILNDRAAANLFPQPPENECRADASTGNRRRRIVRNCGQDHCLCCKPCARSQQSLQLSTGLQLLETTKRGNHLLTHLVAFTSALDDLQIGAPG